MSEVVEWASGEASLTLDNGETIDVVDGDLFLVEEDSATGGLRFIERLEGSA